MNTERALRPRRKCLEPHAFGSHAPRLALQKESDISFGQQHTRANFFFNHIDELIGIRCDAAIEGNFVRVFPGAHLLDECANA